MLLDGIREREKTILMGNWLNYLYLIAMLICLLICLRVGYK